MSMCAPCLRVSVECQATHFCRDCEENICDTCRQQHAKFRDLLKHEYDTLRHNDDDGYVMFTSDEVVEGSESDTRDIETGAGEHGQSEQNNVDSVTSSGDIAEVSFSVRLGKSGLAQTIGLKPREYDMIISEDGFALKHSQTTVFEADFKLIRRVGRRDDLFAIDIGRAFKFGEGRIDVISSETETIQSTYEAMVKRYMMPKKNH